MTTTLFSPLRLGKLELHNRIVISPMCQYSAEAGRATDWHRLHWGSYALSGAGLMMVEATGVSPEGRITPGCVGLWDDETEAAMASALAFARQFSDMPFGLQLGHAGRKASTARPWHGGHVAPEAGGWQVVGPSAIPFAEGWQTPLALDETGIEKVIADYSAAAKRALRLGFDTIEIHGAHGYLLSSFLSPIANRREDAWGGSLENRMRLPLAVFDAVRSACPSDFPVGMRLNGTDWLEGGIVPDEAVALAHALRDHGCDYVDISSGGNGMAKIPVGPAYQLPFASRIKREVGIPVLTVGMIRSPLHAEAIIATGDADAVALGRVALNNPRWPWHAAEELGVKLDVVAPYRFGATNQYRPTFGR
ncbi:NADH:flavin oxidoreductase/NADH oxidase [Microvirga sp. 17 mud 1-3]|uniref:NADH:flavin oxidoreductase/NADH oxidase n=1 Tax=Microvirga sp. 17 mud 1-3 TaxID=2082949 RepID=UPI000D6C4273|nr:NADH:flavin oxidoreductase/NADH oxidase [Microvirga sp. 17 mud 1-3]AWM88422.1 oxidoreductase [Microvirga sp. 17 mud 1-3]